MTTAEITATLGHVKDGKATGADGLIPEFIKNLGHKGRSWLANLFSYILKTSELPEIWHES